MSSRSTKTKVRNKVRLTDRRFLPTTPGLYFVYWEGAEYPDQPLCIGKAQNIRERWGNNYGYGPHHHLKHLQHLNAKAPIWIKTRPIRATFWMKARLQHAEAKAIARHERRYGQIPELNGRRESVVWWLAIIDFVQLWTLCFGFLLVVAAIVSPR